MTHTLYTVSGCVRCKVARAFLESKAFAYQEKDIQGQGREDFQQFYRQNRPSIYRGRDGIEFPILQDDGRIIQGIGPICAWLQAGDRLDGFVDRSELGQGWVDGLHLSRGAPALGQDLLLVLKHLQEQGLFLQPDTDGRNPEILKGIIDNRLVNRLVFHLLGPAKVYAALTGTHLEEAQLKHSLQLAVQSPEYELVLQLLPIPGAEGSLSYLSPEEAARTAALVEESTGSKKHPFVIESVPPPPDQDLQPLDRPALFKYRTACRRYQVLAEIRK